MTTNAKATDIPKRAKKKPPKKETIELRVSFDAEQLSNRLVWDFDSEQLAALVHGHRDGAPPFSNTGRHAGAVHFDEGDKLKCKVIGFGPKDFLGFEVTDCTLITVPAAYLHKPAPPSPFDIEHATQELKFGKAERKPAGKHTSRRYVAACRRTLKVVEDIGVWELSLIVTVALDWKPGSKHEHRQLRVFRFDPESEVGSGVLR